MRAGVKGITFTCAGCSTPVFGLFLSLAKMSIGGSEMPKFVYAYHGGTMPEDPAAIEAEMAAWGAWFEAMGSAVIDGGNPVGMSKTVSNEGVADNGGSNPISGYTLVDAANIDAACDMAKGCPIIKNGGSIEVAEAIPMD